MGLWIKKTIKEQREKEKFQKDHIYVSNVALLNFPNTRAIVDLKRKDKSR